MGMNVNVSIQGMFMFFVGNGNKAKLVKKYFLQKDLSKSPAVAAGFFVYRHLVLVVVDKNNYANCYAIF